MKHRIDPAPRRPDTGPQGATRLPTKTVKPTSPSTAQTAAAQRGMKDKITWLAIHDLTPFPGNPRHHPEAQIARLMRSIEQVWTNPILIDETATILAGHGRWEAAKRLGRTEVPTLTIAGLSAAEKRAVVIADNRLPEQAVWDFDLLRGHFTELIEVDFDVELTGFSTGEIDLLLDGKPTLVTADPVDDLTGFSLDGPAISQSGDCWELGRHRLVCGDALQHRVHRVAKGRVGPNAGRRSSIQRADQRAHDGPRQGASSRIQDGVRRDVGRGFYGLPGGVHPPSRCF